MASNGGTLHGVPQPTRGLNSCNQCGLTFDSSDSLQVHVHYHHTENSINRWGQVTGGTLTSVNNGILPPPPPTSISSNASNSPTDTENNNQPKHQNLHKSASPLNNTHTISAAADSSDNQPPTPQPTGASEQHHQQSRSSQGYSASGPNLSYQQQQQQLSAHEMHYPSYMPGYDQYYHQHTMEYGMPPSHYLNNPLPLPPSQQEYKSVPSSNRYHPYSSIHSHLPYPAHHSASAINSVNGTSAGVQSAISPRVVTSSSPIQNNLMHSTTVPSSVASGTNSQANVNTGQPTPSPSPNQCDKCGLVCDTSGQLSDHQATAHSSANSNEPPNSINRTAGNGDIENDIQSFQYTNYAAAKEEPECDILDLDSQKMVYPPHEMNQGPLPPMHSLHPMQRSMLWPTGHPSHEPHGYLPMAPPPGHHHPSDIKGPLYGSLKNEFSPSIIKQDYSGSHHQTQLSNPQSVQQTSPPDVSKSFASDVSGNQIATSPSEFPSTTTPQENGPQFRTFEAASSTLPNPPAGMKSTSWKSNEARRPKTYNCTACNKWFTSSGHLKRHYNTTLHKNAVKSSGQPDPATLPISVHHHPARDSSTKHHHRHNNIARQQQQQQQQQTQQQQQQQSSLPQSQTRSPEYSPQYTPPSLGFPQSHPINAVGFQQYGTTALQSTPGISPNGQAGLSVLVSQPRGLLNYSSNTGTHSNNQHMLHQQQPEQHNHHRHSDQDFIQDPPSQQQLQPVLLESTITSINSMAAEQQYHITTPITINTNITPLYPVTMHPEQHQPNYTTTGNDTNAVIVDNSSSDCHSLSPAHDEIMHSAVVHYYNSDGTYTSSTSPSLTIDTSVKEYDIKTEYIEEEEHIIRSNYYESMYPNENDLQEYTTTTIPSISAIRRLNGDVYHADTVPPFSPDIPDKKILTPYQRLYLDRSSTPQTGEIVPAHLSPNGPSHTYPDTSILNEPGSPSITSTNTINGHDQITVANLKTLKPKSSVSAAKKRSASKRTAAEAAAALANGLNGITTTEGETNGQQNNDPLRCGPCDKVFNKACYLTQHNKTFHSGEKPYKCQRCGKRFPCDQTHDEHLAKHIGNKPFKCNQCTKQFNHKTDLRRHMCLHTGTKPYSCEICNKGFIRKDHMVKHGLTHLKRKNSEIANDGNANHSITAAKEKYSKRSINHLNAPKRRKIVETPL